MGDYKAPVEDIRFVMQDVFNLPNFWATLEGISDVDEDTASAIIEEAAKICEQAIGPLNREADEEGCTWSETGVTTPKGFKEAYETFCEGGWGGLGGNPEYDGMGMPKTLVCAVEEMVQGACISFGLAPMLTSGAALAINAHASDDLKAQYLPRMYSGEWSGAMDLTEPHCGTDLGLIRTKATPNDDGSFNITGTKIFITWGEHDMAENIVHLVLAKLPDAPEGSRGISLFLVPKFLPNDAGDIGERNAVNCGSIEKKMGIKASATCVMNFDDAKGWLVGEENKGLACMFTMMNYERLTVGIQGLGVAQNSYTSALEYAKERLQGRSPNGPKSPELAADNLLVHADVRRMLLSMKAWNEGGRAFYVYLAQFLDLAKYGASPEDRERGEKISALLTPVCKAFMTDVALESAIAGQQVLGGHGFVREWGQEQHVRDIRITQIYEGTNGVQAMDLIGRKTVMTSGEFLEVYLEDVHAFIDSVKDVDNAGRYLAPLADAMALLRETTELVIKQTNEDRDAPGSAAVDYLAMFGLVSYAHMWAKMAITALTIAQPTPLTQAKIKTADYFFAKHLPMIHSYKAKIGAGASTLMAFDDEQF